MHEDVILWSGCIVNKLYKSGVIENPLTYFSVFFYYFDPENYIEHTLYFQWVDDINNKIWHIPAVLLTWLSIKFHYYLPFEVLIFTSVILLRSMAFFYSLLWAGDTAEDCYPSKPFNLQNYHTFSEIIRWQVIEQWMNTIVIIDLIMIIMRVLYWLAQAGINEKPLHVIFALACGFILYTFCKEYLKEYVDLSKI